MNFLTSPSQVEPSDCQYLQSPKRERGEGISQLKGRCLHWKACLLAYMHMKESVCSVKVSLHLKGLKNSVKKAERVSTKVETESPGVAADVARCQLINNWSLFPFWLPFFPAYQSQIYLCGEGHGVCSVRRETVVECSESRAQVSWFGAAIAVSDSVQAHVLVWVIDFHVLNKMLKVGNWHLV